MAAKMRARCPSFADLEQIRRPGGRVGPVSRTGQEVSIRLLRNLLDQQWRNLSLSTSLAPAERVALVLHDVFDFPFDRIAEVLGGPPARAVRASRGA
jgi:DNA-directed RNA polymerase specialized sigma24 family protein